MQDSPQTTATPPAPLVWWVLWAAFQIGIVIVYNVVGKSVSPGRYPEAGPWAMALLPVLISGALRWSLLPKITDAVKALPVFVVGIALSEATCFIGLFVFPSHKLVLFLAAFVGILQYMPIFANRFSKVNLPE